MSVSCRGDKKTNKPRKQKKIIQKNQTEKKTDQTD
jgi:hypothetical protein